MKSPEWKTYRTRFLIKAKQLTSALSFTDHLGRQHCGRKGDYLVESFEGLISIAPRHIFEDIYVLMHGTGAASDPLSDSNDVLPGNNALYLRDEVRIEELRVERIRDAKYRFQPSSSRAQEQAVPSRVRRKAPQPVRHTPPRIGLM